MGPFFNKTMDDLRRDGLPRAWEGEVAYVVASGPSLRGFDYGRIDGLNVVAVNLQHRSVPFAPVCYFSDRRCWQWYKASFIEHPGLKITCQSLAKVDHPDVLNVRSSGRRGLEDDPRKIKDGNCSAYGAMHVAYHLGAAKIVVLGLDLREGQDGRHHAHDEHPVQFKPIGLEKMAIYFPTLAAKLRSKGVEVVNASPTSRLDCFPKLPIDQCVP